MVDRGTEGLTLTVTGSDFVRSSVVRFDGADRPTQFVSRTRLHATLTASDLAQAGFKQILVANPAPGGGASNAVQLTIGVPTNPVPTITAATPEQLLAGTGSTAVTLTGMGFVPETRIHDASSFRPVTYLSSTQLRIEFTAEDLAIGRTYQLKAVNPQPGGGQSAAFGLEVLNPVPALASLGTPEAVAGQDSLVLRVNGSGFTAASAVSFNGAPRPTRFISPTALDVVLQEGDLRSAGTFAITVVNPGPGGGTSNSGTLSLTNGVPEALMLPSRGATAGGQGFDLYVHGTGFVQGSTVLWNTSPRPTEYISRTRVRATIPAADLATAGIVGITVRNPAPGGGTSQAVLLEVRAPGPPTVSSQRVVLLPAKDVVYVPQTRRLYVSVPGGSPDHPNSVAAIDPATGSVVGAVFVGSEPGRLAASDDGQFLYVGLNGASAVRRVDIGTFTAGLQWALPNGQVAGDLAVAPGQPGVVAVSRHSPGISPPLEGVTIYDAGVARAVSTPGHTGGNRIEFLESPTRLYGYNNAHTGFDFFVIGIDATGARHLSATGGLISGFYTDISGAAGRIYGTDGSIVDAERRVRVGRFSRGGASITVDAATGRAYMLDGPAIVVYDINSFQRLGAILIGSYGLDHPASANPSLVRWGTDGLAFIAQNGLHIVRSPIVAP